MNIDNPYTQMQSSNYEKEAADWTADNRDPVVGSFDEHNKWADWNEYLFKDINTTGMKALDFGCGPGRSIVLYKERFASIDGADIANNNLVNARLWLEKHGVKNSKLYKVNGTELDGIPSTEYDMVFSTICMQHICVHEIRYRILNEMFRVLKPGGYICIQMGYGGKADHKWVNYYDNYYEAGATNGQCDVSVENVQDVASELKEIGFKDFKYDLRPTGPGDKHKQWLFFRAQMPCA